MRQGNLAETSLAVTLLTFAQEWRCGCLHPVDTDDEEAVVYQRQGAVYVIAELVHGGTLDIVAEPDSWQAAAKLSELTRDCGSAGASGADDASESAARVATDDETMVAAEVPGVHLNDTASLMRELSFLGVDEPPAAASGPARPSRPHPPAVQKKRKGIFGR